MRYFFPVFFLVLLFCVAPFGSHAQTQERHKIAVFAPLYLDSAFDARGSFKYERTGARFLTPGLDFYYGVQMALDSLEKRGAPLEVFVYDIKSREGLGRQLNSLEQVEMIIANSNAQETKMLADYALKNKIPFISATLPNDAGVFNNPYFVVLNSTLQSHVEGMYRFLQRYYPLEKVIVFRKSGAQEDQLKGYFQEFAGATVSSKLDLKFVDLGANFTAQSLLPYLDSTKKNIVIAGSLEEAFGIKLSQTLAGLKKYPVMLMGMPTWDNFNLARNELSNLEIVYTTPFYYNLPSPLGAQLANRYTAEMSLRPSDQFFRGFETTLRFALLLLDTKKDIASNLTRKGNTVLTQFDIQPVFKDRSKMNLDYFENKHLYFIKVLGGAKNVLY